MRVYVVKQEDLDRLLAFIDRNPAHGARGGSSDVLTDTEQRAHEKAHRFFNYQIRIWIGEITQ
jgi:hypothetical protein